MVEELLVIVCRLENKIIRFPALYKKYIFNLTGGLGCDIGGLGGLGEREKNVDQMFQSE